MKKKLKIATAIGAVILPMSLLAGFNSPPPGYGGTTKNKNASNETSLKYPHDSSPELIKMPAKLRQNNFELNINVDEVEEVHGKVNRFKKLMDGTYGVNIMQKIDYRALKAIDHIYLLSNYTSTITFPPQYKIESAVSSTELKENRSAQNILFLQPDKSFVEGNIVVSLSDGRKNTIVSIVMDKFIKQSSVEDNVFNSFINYVEVPIISDYKLLKVYFRMYGDKRISHFSKNGKFDIIEYKKVPFYIIRDDKFGKIEFRGVNFRIANNT